MDFGNALKAVKEGERISRLGWNETNAYVELQVPDENSKMKRPYLFMRPANGAFVPWVASHSDILAEDWYVL